MAKLYPGWDNWAVRRVVMKVYVQGRHGIPGSVSSYDAYLGFCDMGFEVVVFDDPKDLRNATKEDLVVGGIGIVRSHLENLGANCPDIDYPEELSRFLCRKLWRTTIDRVNCEVDSWPVFVKPVEEKRFTGCVIRSTADLIGKGCRGDNYEVICSEPVNMLSEYRCFVRRGEILDVRHYRGDWSLAPNRAVIEAAASAYTSAPAGYAADFAVTDKGETVLVEVNDGYSLGSYGLWHDLYAQLLSARWFELVGSPDPCDFGLPIPPI
jgi:hypothetical protein